MSSIEEKIKELTDSCRPQPYTVEQPACMTEAKRIFKEIKKEGLSPSTEQIKKLAMENGWDKENADQLVKRMKRYLS